MSIEGRFFTWTIEAGEDLNDLTPVDGHIFKAVTMTGVIANNGYKAGGILLYGGMMNEHVTLGYAGIMKFTTNEKLEKGALLTVGRGGFFRAAKEGDWIVGRCLDQGATAMSVATGAFNFASISKWPVDSKS